MKPHPSNLIIALMALTIVPFSSGAEHKSSGAKATSEARFGYAFYRIPPNMFSSFDSSGKLKYNSDFKPIQNPDEQLFDASGYLKEQGVTFPQGSEAIYNRALSFLVVRNTSENIDLADTIFDTRISGIFASIAGIELYAIECTLPAEKILPSAKPMTYAELEHLAEKSIKLLDCVSTTADSGQRSFVSHVFAPEGSESKANIAFVGGESGTKAEVDSVIHQDLSTINLSIVYRFRPRVGDAKSKVPQEINFVTSCDVSADCPLVLHLSPDPNHEGKYIAIVARVRIMNPAGWTLKDIREAAKTKVK
jgi:hypothetical protein